MFRVEYQEVRRILRAGDLIAFGGNGFVSRAIKFFTRSPVSHVGVIQEGFDVRRRVLVCESTQLGGFSGVVSNPFSERLEAYPGNVWWLPLRDSIAAKIPLGEFFAFLQSQVGKKYDSRSVAHFAFDVLHLWAQAENVSRLFCSELVALSWKQFGVLPVWINSSEVRPVDLCRFNLYAGCYQLKGKTCEIKDVNSRDPQGWRN
jgi:hypothetical protein